LTYHPQAQQLLDAIAESGAPPFTEMTPRELREEPAFFREMVGAGPDVALVRDIEIPGPGGAIPARVYEPVPEPVGTVVYYHGGGWVLGDLDDFDAVCRALAVAASARLVSVDYRLAPEHRFPAAADDAFAALAWVAERYPGDPLVVAGDSAGGNLAAVSALRSRDAGGPEIVLQVLVYPVVDCDPTRPSYAQCAETNFIINAAEMAWFWDHYVPDAGERVHPHASPIRAGSLEGLPPAYVVIAEHDPLRDEGLAYAAALEAASVPVTVARYEDQIHGFFVLVNLMESADRAVEEAGAAIRGAVAAVPARSGKLGSDVRSDK
jgi:acetyl esterase